MVSGKNGHKKNVKKIGKKGTKGKKGFLLVNYFYLLFNNI